jgi:hypothetical protein
MNLDEELTNALRRKAPPEGFRARVLAACRADTAVCNATEADKSVHAPWPRLAAAALLALLLGGTAIRVIEGYRAKQQVLLAMHITSQKLRDARDRVAERGTR